MSDKTNDVNEFLGEPVVITQAEWLSALARISALEHGQGIIVRAHERKMERLAALEELIIDMQRRWVGVDGRVGELEADTPLIQDELFGFLKRLSALENNPPKLATALEAKPHAAPDLEFSSSGGPTSWSVDSDGQVFEVSYDGYMADVRLQMAEYNVITSWTSDELNSISIAVMGILKCMEDASGEIPR